MLMELIIFAIVLVLLQTIAGVVIFKVMTSKKVLTKTTNVMMDVTKEMQEKLLEDLL